MLTVAWIPCKPCHCAATDVPFTFGDKYKDRSSTTPTAVFRRLLVWVDLAVAPLPDLPVDLLCKRTYRVSFSHDASCAVAWEVSAGEAGKVCTIRSTTVVVNRTNLPVEVSVTRAARQEVVGEVASPGVLPVPLMLLAPESLAVRPSMGGGGTCGCADW